jgi:DNA-directed RNA polymerase II subunit RPB2
VFYVRRNGKGCWTGNSRGANGPVVLMTRQPAEGRARDGGLRLGEMELECLWAHGLAGGFLKERFMDCSDNYRCFTCKQCGAIAAVNPERGLYYCNACENMTDFSEIRIPYACKLFLTELGAMSIGTKIET